MRKDKKALVEVLMNLGATPIRGRWYTYGLGLIGDDIPKILNKVVHELNYYASANDRDHDWYVDQLSYLIRNFRYDMYGNDVVVYWDGLLPEGMEVNEDEDYIEV